MPEMLLSDAESCHKDTRKTIPHQTPGIIRTNQTSPYEVDGMDTITEAKKDYMHHLKLCTQAELKGIINWLVTISDNFCLVGL